MPQAGSMVSVEQLEEGHLRKVLERTFNLAEPAEPLGIDQAMLYRKSKKLGWNNVLKNTAGPSPSRISIGTALDVAACGKIRKLLALRVL